MGYHPPGAPRFRMPLRPPVADSGGFLWQEPQRKRAPLTLTVLLQLA